MQIKMEVTRYPGETDSDLIANTMEHYGADAKMVYGQVLADQVGAGGNAVILWTGDADSLAALHAAYLAEAEALAPVDILNPDAS